MEKFLKRVKRRPLASTLLFGTTLALLAAAATALVYAAGPDPTVKALPMSWQKVAEPVPNTGVDAKGRTLQDFVAGANGDGMTLAAWTAAGRDQALWRLDAKTKGKATDWRPIESRAFRAGTKMYVLRNQEFAHKLADPKIQRRFICGSGISGITPYALPPIEAPTRSNGPAVKNHATDIPADLVPAGAGPQQCRYESSAVFLKSSLPAQTVEVPFLPVVVVITPAVGPLAK